MEEIKKRRNEGRGKKVSVSEVRKLIQNGETVDG